MTPEDRQFFCDILVSTVKTTVNGKIDDIKTQIAEHNTKHEEDMKRVVPVLEAYEAAERRLDDAKASGKVVLWVAGFITAVGGAYLVLKQTFNF